MAGAMVAYATNVPLSSGGGQRYHIIAAGKAFIRWRYSAVCEGGTVDFEHIVLSRRVFED